MPVEPLPLTISTSKAQNQLDVSSTPLIPSSAHAMKIGECFQVEALKALTAQLQEERAVRAREDKVNKRKMAEVLKLLHEEMAENGKCEKVQ